MSKDKKITFKFLGAHTDNQMTPEGVIVSTVYAAGDIVSLTLKESKEPAYRNKLVRVVDDSKDSEIIEQATARAEKIIADAEKKAGELIIDGTKKAEALVSTATELVKKTTAAAKKAKKSQKTESVSDDKSQEGV